MLLLLFSFLKKTRIREYENVWEDENTGIREYKTIVLSAEVLPPASITYVLSPCLLVFMSSSNYSSSVIPLLALMASQ